MRQIKVCLNDNDWRDEFKGWRCEALLLPKLQIVAMIDLSGKKIQSSDFKFSREERILFWNKAEQPPEFITLILESEIESRSQELSKKWRIAAIFLPLLTAVISPLIVSYVNKSTVKADKIGWHSLLHNNAYESFTDGYGALTKNFEGSWKVTLFSNDSTGNRTPLTVGGQVYRPETAFCKVNGSLVAFESFQENGDRSGIWAEGRASTAGFVTLLVWSDKNKFQRDIVAVNLLRVNKDSLPRVIKLEGYRLGVNGGGKIEKGEIEYRKELQ